MANETPLDRFKAVLGGTGRDVSVLFADIRGFTSISERLGAKETVALLNETLRELETARAVQQNRLRRSAPQRRRDGSGGHHRLPQPTFRVNPDTLEILEEIPEVAA